MSYDIGVFAKVPSMSSSSFEEVFRSTLEIEVNPIDDPDIGLFSAQLDANAIIVVEENIYISPEGFDLSQYDYYLSISIVGIYDGNEAVERQKKSTHALFERLKSSKNLSIALVDEFVTVLDTYTP